MRASDTPIKIEVPFAQNGPRQLVPVESQVNVEPGRASFDTGFPPATMIAPAAGGVPPYGTDFNGVLYAITSLLRWQNSGGTYTYDADLAEEIGGYPAGAVLLKGDGLGFWLNQDDENQSNPDVASEAYGWVDLGSDTSIQISRTLEAAPDAQNVSDALYALSDRLVKAENSIPAVTDATTQQKGIVRLATVPQHLDGVSGFSATPAGVLAMIEDRQFAFTTLTGDTQVFPGAEYQYTITNYSDFSTYSVSASIGSASINGNLITLTVPDGAAGDQIDLVVTRDGSNNTFTLALGETSIATPFITYPSNDEQNVDIRPSIMSSAFRTFPAGVDTHQSSDWQVATDSAFNSVVASSFGDEQNLTAWTPSSDLPRNTNVYTRVRYNGASLGQTEWSAPVMFRTVNRMILTPIVTSPVDGAVDVPERPIIESSAFETSPSGVDSHKSSSWRIMDADGEVVWQSLENASSLSSITVPAGVLSEGFDYSVQVKHEGLTLPSSEWSLSIAFTTAQSFIPTEPGQPFGGGYYVGRMTDSIGEYLLVIAPKSSESSSRFANGMNGYNDWKGPLTSELWLSYWYLKPGSTLNVSDNITGEVKNSIPPKPSFSSSSPSVTESNIFSAGNSEAFETREYWASDSNFSSGNVFNYVNFNNGRTQSASSGSYIRRSIRRVYI